ncbi:Putative transposable element [Caligus rogercresseyi]|uniref:Transposable element n=1 Tax=Caligus rogercresseyi TaxID=217165 RepID=A0A7T8QWV5_CALRO|nr:Putative transposable element [Caligus rogercresseyi]
MAPICLTPGYKLTAADYLEILKTKITKKAKKSSYVFQQDGARRAYGQHLAQEHVAPPEPRLETPGLFHLWHVESKACKIRHSNVNDLKTSVNKLLEVLAQSVRDRRLQGILLAPPRGRYRGQRRSNHQ